VRYPASIVAGLFVLVVYWWRSRPLQNTPDSGTVPLALLWAGAAGALGFLLTHLALPTAPWAFLLAGSIGIGGAAGLGAWLVGNILVLNAIAARWLIIMLWRRGGSAA